MTGSPTATLDPDAAPPAVQEFLASVRPAIDDELERRLAALAGAAGAGAPARLVEAMRYAATGPGKRLRPALVVAAAQACGAPLAACLPAAAAIELLHAYTLVHDDLPAMDDDVERRGRPTVHVAYDQATAILAGDGLLTAAFACLAELGAGCARAVEVLGARAGAAELLAGQAIDLARDADAAVTELAAIEVLHARKTGALFAAAAELGAIAAGADRSVQADLGRYGMALGIAFQHADDRDDNELVELAEAAARRIAELAEEARTIAAGLGPSARPLIELAAWMGSKA